MGIRHIQYGFDNTTKTYATEDNLMKAVTKLTGSLIGEVNVLVLQLADGRWTALFSCLTDMNDAQYIARAGFMCHR